MCSSPAPPTAAQTPAPDKVARRKKRPRRRGPREPVGGVTTKTRRDKSAAGAGTVEPKPAGAAAKVPARPEDFEPPGPPDDPQ